MISINEVQEFLESVFNFIFVMLSITTFLFLYSEKKKKLRSLIDKEVLEEMNTPLAKFYDKIHYLITLVPFVEEDPEILFLDEATSSLDTESEQLIQASVESLTENDDMVIIVIAHRLSTIRAADQIYILENGCVAEEGTYDDLLQNRESRLSQMVRHQTL